MRAPANAPVVHGFPALPAQLDSLELMADKRGTRHAAKSRNQFFYPHDSEHECDRTIGSFSHQSGITREQLSLPLASPPSPSGIRGIRWVAQSIDLWLVSRGHLMTPMKYSDRHLAGLFAGPPDRVELIGAGSLGYGTGPSFG